MLTSYEKTLLAHFVTQSKECQKEILQGAINDPKTSGPLVHAYRMIFEFFYGEVACHGQK